MGLSRGGLAIGTFGTNPDGPVLKWAGQTVWAGRIRHLHPATPHPPVNNLLAVTAVPKWAGLRVLG